MQRKLQVAVTAAIAGVALAALATSTLGNTQHYKMVDELGGLARWTNTEMMVHGTVVAGSIREDVIAQETQRTFLLEHGGKRVRVFSAGPKPDTFKDYSDVVAVGHIIPARDKREIAGSLHVTIEADYVVDASELRAKCPTRYTGAESLRGLKKQPFD